MEKKHKIIVGFILMVTLGVVIHWLLNFGQEQTDDAAIEAHTTAISPKISGYLVKVYMQDNQLVNKGDLVAEIDADDYRLQCDLAKANLAKAIVLAENAATNAKRMVTIGKLAGSQKAIDDTLARQKSAEAAVESARIQLAIAEKNLADTKIIAPDTGNITLRAAEPGAYVMPGQQLAVLVGSERWIVANYKEVQINKMHPGQKVDITIDAYPDLKLTGQIESIQRGSGARFSAFPPENATGNFVKIVQRVPVKIIIDNNNLPADHVVGPGLSVVPTVHTR